MAMRPILNEVWTEAGEAQGKAADAFDNLLSELGKDAGTSSDLVTRHLGQAYVHSLRFSALLWLAPLRVAQGFADGGQGSGGQGSGSQGSGGSAPES